VIALAALPVMESNIGHARLPPGQIAAEGGKKVWSQHYEALGYASGLAPHNGELWVSWAMSHFGAHSQVQVHRADGSADK
jgi:hypothetical protein